MTQREDIVYENSDPERTLIHDLLHDALQLFAQAWRNASYFYPERMAVPRMNCDAAAAGGRTWPMGRYLMRLMKAVSQGGREVGGKGNINRLTWVL